MKCSDCGTNIKPVVAVDIDGTLAKWHEAFVEFAEKYLNPYEGFPRGWDGMGEFNDHLGLEKSLYRTMKLAFRQGGFKRWMKQFPGAQLMMWELRQMGVEVWITTTRPWQRLDNIDPDTKEWLWRNGIQFDHLIFDEDKLGLLCNLVDPERIVGVVDNEPEVIRRAVELKLPAIFVRNGWNYDCNIPEGVPDVSRLDYVVDQIRMNIGARDALSH